MLSKEVFQLLFMFEGEKDDEKVENYSSLNRKIGDGGVRAKVVYTPPLE